MTIRVLGIDPGLTRCGVGIVDVGADRRATLVHVTVIRTHPQTALEKRLLAIGTELDDLLATWNPHAVAIERVFAQQNVSTVMGTAQVSGVALQAAAKRGLPVEMHTPSEVKAAVSGYGSADKTQVATMVARILGLAEAPKPADAADALAIAICHAWRRGSPTADAAGAVTSATTPAQRAWLAAERAAKSDVDRRLGR